MFRHNLVIKVYVINKLLDTPPEGWDREMTLLGGCYILPLFYNKGQ